MKTRGKAGQRGGILGLVFILAVLGGLGAVGMQLFPTFVEYQAALKAVNKAAASGTTVVEVRNAFDKAAQVDDIKSISGKDLEITKNGDKVVASFAYNKEVHIAGPAYLVMKYTGTSK
jgi:alpha-D-ribose 1-methylphosphonate 5-phosphate C-P lyase